jgi:hypothetical protein
MAWGRDLASFSLDTRTGPAFKPLPVFAGAVLSPLGDAAPWVWLVAARAGALLAAVMAWRLASRLAGEGLGSGPSVVAGAVAFAGVLLTGGWVWNGWLGNAEGLYLALVLVGAERALDGRHRQALLLGLLAALVRTEAAPFLLVYCGWVWRRDPGARAWIAASLAALPVAWLGPDLVAAGDAFRSSERARIPNPGAPALADRPAIESLGRALALAPTVVWAGTVLAIVGVARHELPRLAAFPAAAGLAWLALVALMSELGYSGEERYAMPGVALVAVSAGIGVAWAVQRVSRSRAPAAAVLGTVLVALAVGEQAGALRDDARSVRHEARLYNALDDAVAAAGGRGAVLRCGPIHTAPYSRPALAWRLRVQLRRLSTEPASGGGTVFRARPWEGAPLGPAIGGAAQPTGAAPPGGAAPSGGAAQLRPVASAGEWTVLSSCPGGG